MVQWLIKRKEAGDVDEAIILGQALVDNGLMHHGELGWGVCEKKVCVCVREREKMRKRGRKRFVSEREWEGGRETGRKRLGKGREGKGEGETKRERERERKRERERERIIIIILTCSNSINFPVNDKHQFKNTPDLVYRFRYDDKTYKGQMESSDIISRGIRVYCRLHGLFDPLLK